MTFLRTHLTTVVVAGVTALACSAGGAVAASMITGAQIKDNTVSSVDIKDNTLRRVDLSAALIASLKGARGAPGADGTNGTNGVSGYVIVSDSKSVTSGSLKVPCPAGTRIIGGGAGFQESNTGVQFLPTDDGSGGTGYGNTGGAAQTLTVRIVCAAVG